jgi:hypothetical protein
MFLKDSDEVLSEVDTSINSCMGLSWLAVRVGTWTWAVCLDQASLLHVMFIGVQGVLAALHRVHYLWDRLVRARSLCDMCNPPHAWQLLPACLCLTALRPSDCGTSLGHECPPNQSVIAYHGFFS